MVASESSPIGLYDGSHKLLILGYVNFNVALGLRNASLEFLLLRGLDLELRDALGLRNASIKFLLLRGQGLGYVNVNVAPGLRNASIEFLLLRGLDLELRVALGLRNASSSFCFCEVKVLDTLISTSFFSTSFFLAASLMLKLAMRVFICFVVVSIVDDSSPMIFCASSISFFVAALFASNCLMTFRVC